MVALFRMLSINMQTLRMALVILGLNFIFSGKSNSKDFVVNLEIVGDVELSQGVVAQDWSVWLPEFSHVDLVICDYQVSDPQPLVVNGRLHPGILENRVIRLSAKEVSNLESLVTGKHSPTLGALCYIPRHGFIFYGEKGEIVGHLEICFSCFLHRSYPKEGLSQYWDWLGLLKFIRQKEIPANLSEKDWNRFFERERIEIPADPKESE